MATSAAGAYRAAPPATPPHAAGGRARRTAAALLSIGLVAAVPMWPSASAAPGSGPTPGARSGVLSAREILRDHRYQTALPDPRPAAGPEWSLRLPTLTIPRLVPILLAVVLLVVLATWVANRRRSGQNVSAVRAGPRAHDGGPEEPRSQVARAERLASEGRYAEAIHELLLAAIHGLERAAGMSPGASSTSREILRGLPAAVPAERREALAELVRHVELSWFGGRAQGRTEFAACLASYRRIAGR